MNATHDTKMTTSAISIPLHRVWAVEKRLEEAQKKADRLGLPPVSWAITDAGHDGMVDVEITAPPVKIAGWKLHAVLDWRLDSGESLVHTLPGISPLENPPRACVCEHCGTNRDRKRTFIVGHDDGETQQIGSSCLADFVGGDVAMMVAQANLVCDDFAGMPEEEEVVRWNDSRTPVPIRTFLAACCMYDERVGFVSRGQAEKNAELGLPTGPATSDLAWDLCHGQVGAAPHADLDETSDRLGRPWNSREGEPYPFADRHWEAADSVLDFVRGDAFVDDSEYANNIRTLAKESIVRSRHAGFVASMVPTVSRHTIGKFAERHFGEVKGRTEFEAEIVSTKLIEPYQYGGSMRCLYTFKTNDGERLSWMSSRVVDGLRKGVVGKFKATVKDHRHLRDGTYDTRLNRVALQELLRGNVDVPVQRSSGISR